MPTIENKDDWSAIKERITVLGDKGDDRYSEYPFSEILIHYRIAHTGVINTGHPYELTRVNQSGSCMVVTLEGEGKVLVNDEWVVLNPNHACLLPPFADNSIQSLPGKEWTFAWIKYLETEGTNPIVPSLTPIYAPFDASSLKHAIYGLNENQRAKHNKILENLWVEAIHQHVLMFARPKVLDERLWALWQEVSKSLDTKWTLTTLAEHANMSKEHLRRLCQLEYGRSPKQQLSYIKMRRARILLGQSGVKIETLSKMLGYSSIAAFSTAFKQYMGFSPSEMNKAP